MDATASSSSSSSSAAAAAAQSDYEGYATLVEEQRVLFRRVVAQRQSLFYTGEAGTGKTQLAQCIIAALERDGVAVAACAPTAQAAENLDGFTVHQLFGLVPLETGANRRCGQWVLRDTLLKLQVLVVDEVSMASQALFDDMDRRLQSLRHNTAPFGGVQVVAVGDFLQLPPIGAANSAARRYCFHSRAFTALFGDRLFRLRHQHRQCTDERFAHALAQIRVGKCPPEVVRLIESRRYQPQHCPLPEEMPHLKCRLDDVERCNRQGLDALPSSPTVWEARDTVVDEKYRPLCRTFKTPARLELKRDAPVLLTFNMDLSRGLRNGLRGVVTAVLSQCELGRARCSQPSCAVCSDRTPVRHGVEVLGTLPPEPHTPLPLVLFDNGLECAVGLRRVEKHATHPSPDGRRLVQGAVVATRDQLPLIVAYSFSVHKSQGMTLDKSCVSLDRAFDCGQVYVALSRVRSLDALHLATRLPRHVIKVADDALEFDTRRVVGVFAA